MKFCTGALTAFAVVAVALAVHAEDTSSAVDDDPWIGVEEMLVTGGSTVGLLSDVTTSSIAFDATELTAIGAQDVSDLARFTPSLEINTTSATTPTFFIRGVGLNDANANASGAIAIYVDDIPINAPAMQLAGLFDTEAVEVLRGPQAYIDARNASGGMINTVSRKPDGEFSAFLRSDFGRFSYRDVEGAVGFPIFDEIVSGRIAFRSSYRDDLIKNRCGNISPPDTRNQNACDESRQTGGVVPSGLPSETNDLDRWGVRGQIRVIPPDAPAEMEWLLNVHAARIDQTSPLGQVLGTGQLQGVTGSLYIDSAVKAIFDRNFQALQANPPPGSTPSERTALARSQTLTAVTRDIEKAEPFENDYDLVGDEVLSQLGGFLRSDMQFGDVSFKSITGIEHYDRELETDFDFSSNPSIHTQREDDAIQYTQNFGLETELESVPIVLKGGTYLLVELLDTNSSFLLQTRRADQRKVEQQYTQDLYSFGVFGSLAWEISEDLTFEAGIRENWTRKEFELGVDKIRGNGSVATGVPTELTRTWSAPTYGFSLTYFFTEDIHAYGKYTRGWKEGHINASVLEIRGSGGQDLAVATPSVAKPETVDSYELGFGVSLFDQRLELNTAGFYYRYSDYQVFLIEAQVGSPPQLEIINANDARIYGIEIDAQVEPLTGLDAVPEVLSGLTISANFAWLESQFMDFSDIRTVFLPSNDPFQINIGSQVVDFTGNRLPNTPQFTISGTVEWRFDLGRLGTLTPRYDFSWKDDTFFDPSEGVGTPDFVTREVLPKYAIGQRAYALHDLRLTLTDPSGNVSLSGWVRNLTDENYKRNVLDISTAFDQINVFVGDPRTYGASLMLKF
jgi:iron complex outermembrane recepter protein